MVGFADHVRSRSLQKQNETAWPDHFLKWSGTVRFANDYPQELTQELGYGTQPEQSLHPGLS